MSGKKVTKGTKKKTKTTAKKKRGVGKPSKAGNIDLGKIEVYASRGLTKPQIAACLDMSLSAYMSYQVDRPDMIEAYDRGRAKGVAMVAGKLMKNVDNMNQKAIEYYLSRVAKWSETTVIHHGNDEGIPLAVADVSDEEAQEAWIKSMNPQ
ncbi:hypothetical protein [uncultured Paraglaciecola sp.]|uniref:hypothetical protein n=1 Tax=uncultured Paraglaciecola sp. TaxID=1765024 RepID=UPI002619A578|nr:hypothetical protein [uncultured Paraglaciecola sp.]